MPFPFCAIISIIAINSDIMRIIQKKRAKIDSKESFLLDVMA